MGVERPGPASAPTGTGWLRRLALHRPELRAWALYDWANSVVITTIITAVFPIYFQRVVAAELPEQDAARWWTFSTSAALLAVALTGPLLGPVADRRALRKWFFAGFLALGVASGVALFAVGGGDIWLALLLFAGINIGASGSFIFYDALLPHVARPEEVDQVSASGYALGYVSGALLLGLHLAWIQHPDLFGLPSGDDLSPDAATLPTRLALLTAALWWGVFSIPLFLRVREPEPSGEAPPGAGGLVRATLGQARATWGHLRRYPQAARMLLAFLIYNDGIQSIFRLAVIFGALLAFEPGVLMAAILVVQLVGIPCAALFGRLAAKIGTRSAVLIGVGAYLLLTASAFFVVTPTHFVLLATGVGVVQGGTQALSRSLFASLVPRERSAEFFALFAVLEKFAGILGPALFGIVIGITASPRWGILTVLPMFVIGGLLLLRVDVERGRAEAAEADR